MASDIQQTPFIKQLASNDLPTRQKALSSLRAYLSSTHTFTPLELLKIWKGLFFCMFHTANPLPQTHLSQTLSSLLLPLPAHLFIPFLHAFYTTLTNLYPSLPLLRLDKYLYLIRRYIATAFIYLSQHSWPTDLVDGYIALMASDIGPLSRGKGEERKVPDGMRYHVLDVWVEELRGVVGGEKDEGGWGERMMGGVRVLQKEGMGKVLRKRAGDCVAEWERSGEGVVGSTAVEEGKEEEEEEEEEEEDEWDGIGD